MGKTLRMFAWIEIASSKYQSNSQAVNASSPQIGLLFDFKMYQLTQWSPPLARNTAPLPAGLLNDVT
jgi:hypothetical protein